MNRFFKFSEFATHRAFLKLAGSRLRFVVRDPVDLGRYLRSMVCHIDEAKGETNTIEVWLSINFDRKKMYRGVAV